MRFLFFLKIYFLKPQKVSQTHSIASLAFSRQSYNCPICRNCAIMYIHYTKIMPEGKIIKKLLKNKIYG